MRKVLLGVFVLATFAMTPVFAASTATTSASHDAVQGNELLFGANSLTVPFTIDPLSVTMTANVGYQRALMPNIQVGLRGNMGIASTAQFWRANGWLVYNLDEKWTDSVFIGVGFGLNSGTAGFLDLDVAAEVGKRFEICHGLTWRPNLGMTKVLNGAVINFSLNVVNLSYMW